MIGLFEVTNFRSFKDFTLRLGNFNVFIGANAAGKSNLIDAFKFLRDCLQDGLIAAISQRQRWEDVKCRKLYKNDEIKFRLEGQAAMGEIGIPSRVDKGKRVFSDFQFDYQLNLCHEDGRFLVTREEGLLRGREHPQKKPEELSAFQRDLKGVSVQGLIEEHLSKERAPVYPQNESKLFLGAGFFSLASLIIAEEITGWRIYNPVPYEARQARMMEEVDQLSESGDNLPLVLHQLEPKAPNDSGEEKNRVRNQIVETMRALVPGFEDWTTELKDGRVSFKVREEPIKGRLSSNLISDGTVRLLTLLAALLYRRKKPSTVFIEEPEHCLHPLVMENLVEIMREVSSEVQIVVTTHSPDFVRHCQPNEVFLLDKVKGFTQVLQAQEIEQIDKFLTNFTLDELWLMGYLQKLPL